VNGTRVAIMGLSHDSRAFAPWHDKDWEKWGIPWDQEANSFTTLVDMHDQDLNQSPSAGMPTGYRKLLGNVGAPRRLFMQEAFDWAPQSTAYPFAEVNAVVFEGWGKKGSFPQYPVHTQEDWYGSNIAYLLALAISEGYAEIGLFGVDITQQRFDHDRPNMNYLIGFARGQGVDVYVPPTSHMFDMKRLDRMGLLTVEYPQRYGFLAANRKRSQK